MTRSLRTAPGRIAAALVALAMLMAIPLTFGPGKADAQRAPSAPLPAVTVETVTPSPFVREARYTGELASPASVAIVSRVEGILGPLNVEDGATVARGDLLYTISDAEFQAALAVAKANLTSAQAAETLAKSNLDRAQTLAKRNTVSEATVDADQAAYDQAVAARAVAEANLQVAELNLGYTSIASPLDGRIGTQAFREGALVSESSGPLVTVVSTDPMRVRFAVPQRDVLRARSAATAPGSAPTIALILADGSRYAAEAKILYTEPEAETATDSVAIVAEVENPDGHLLDGQLVTVAVSQSVSEDAITVSGSQDAPKLSLEAGVILARADGVRESILGLLRPNGMIESLKQRGLLGIGWLYPPPNGSRGVWCQRLIDEPTSTGARLPQQRPVIAPERWQ